MHITGLLNGAQGQDHPSLERPGSPDQIRSDQIRSVSPDSILIATSSPCYQ